MGTETSEQNGTMSHSFPGGGDNARCSGGRRRVLVVDGNLDSGDDSARCSGGKRRVLVVDDNLDSAEILSALLEINGHLVRVAHSGRGALTLAQDFAPEVVLLDIGLPDLDGYEVARRMRGDPMLAMVTLVAITGWGSASDKQQAINAGFDCHFTKPVQTEQIVSLLASVPQRVGSER